MIALRIKREWMSEIVETVVKEVIFLYVVTIMIEIAVKDQS